MSSDAGNGNQYLYRRLEDLGRRLDRLDEWRSQVDVQRATQAEQMRVQALAMTELVTSVDGLRRMLMTAVIGVASSALILSLSVLIASGKLAP